MGSRMSRGIRFGARTLLVAILTVAMALQGYFPAVTARAGTARPGDAATYEIEVGETVALPSPGGRTTFESSDPRVATVTEGGVVTGVGEGRATIRATIAMSGIGGRLWEWALIIIGRMLGEHDPIAQTVTREFRVVVRPKADERPADGDGIIDADEASLGTDPLRPDTDGDGLSDYEELLLGTDPLTPNGYDAARDSDGDGLADLDEATRRRTDPHARDTDFDGLSDYEEVVTHKTDPLRRDTDGDSLSDKFEVDHGLDPNSGSSDGTHRDDEVKTSQALPESAMSRQLRDESNVARPSLKGEVAGELARHVFLSESGSSTVGDNRAIVGKAVYVDGDDGHVSGLTLSFDLGGYEGDLTYLAIATLDGDGGYAPVDFERTGTTLSATLESDGGRTSSWTSASSSAPWASGPRGRSPRRRRMRNPSREGMKGGMARVPTPSSPRGARGRWARMPPLAGWARGSRQRERSPSTVRRSMGRCSRASTTRTPRCCPLT